MAQSRIDQTSISGGGGSDPEVVEVVRKAISLATEMLDALVPAHTLVVGNVRVGVDLDPKDANAASALAHVIVIEALKSVPSEQTTPPDDLNTSWVPPRP